MAADPRRVLGGGLLEQTSLSESKEGFDKLSLVTLNGDASNSPSIGKSRARSDNPSAILRAAACIPRHRHSDVTQSRITIVGLYLWAKYGVCLCKEHSSHRQPTLKGQSRENQRGL